MNRASLLGIRTLLQSWQIWWCRWAVRKLGSSVPKYIKCLRPLRETRIEMQLWTFYSYLIYISSRINNPSTWRSFIKGETHGITNSSSPWINWLIIKGIVPWDWDWLEWIVNERSKELRIAGAYFYCFWCHFHVLICKKEALSVSHLTVTLRMMRNNCRSVSSIGFLHVWSILSEVSYYPDEEIYRDATCRMIAAIFSSLLRS